MEQEDEDEMARRKMREEDAVVDIDGLGDGDGPYLQDATKHSEPNDEDALWAEDEPDEDDPKWKLKVLIVEEDGF